VEEPFTLDQLYGAIEATLRGSLPGVQTVGAWPDIRDRIALPAVFVEMANFEPGADQGTGETALICKFEARVIVAPERAHHQQQAAHLASQIAVLLRMQDWNLPVGPAQFVQATQDWTKPELDGYTVWVIEWDQDVYLGNQEWPWPDEPPGSLVFSFDPDTGRGNEDKYVPPESLA
jgi:hypothetical protein